MSLLTVVQNVAKEIGIPSPTTVIGNSDGRIMQLLRLLQVEGVSLSVRHQWESLQNEATFVTVAAESQGAITTHASNGFNYIENETFWDRSSVLPVLGPISGPDWQTLKANVSTSTRTRYRIRGGLLLLNPVPAAGLTFAFEYQTKNWVTDSTGVTQKETPSADTDLFLLKESLLEAGLKWRWLKEKGLDYAEDFATYETNVKYAMGRDGGKPRLTMFSTGRNRRPGVFVSDSSWSV